MKISPGPIFHLLLGITSRNFSAALKKELSNANIMKVEIYYTFVNYLSASCTSLILRYFVFCPMFILLANFCSSIIKRSFYKFYHTVFQFSFFSFR